MKNHKSLGLVKGECRAGDILKYTNRKSKRDSIPFFKLCSWKEVSLDAAVIEIIEKRKTHTLVRVQGYVKKS